MRRSNGRHEAIRDIVRTQAIRTQNELVASLRERGFPCTQATVSRDVTEMHLRKLAGGVYVLEEDLNLQLVLSEFVVGVRSSQNLVVVRTQPETARSVAAAIDDARVAHALGTVAGSDTVFVAADSPEGATEICGLVAKLGMTG